MSSTARHRRTPGIVWRIRSIHPTVHRDRALALAERATGLPVLRVYQGLWCAADREGRFPWLVDELQIHILPWDADRWPIAAVLEVLIEGGWIVRYEADGMTWGWVPRLGEWQVFNAKEKASVWPAPPASAAEAWSSRFRPAGQSSSEFPAPDGSSPEPPAVPMPARADTCRHVSTGVDTCRHGQEPSWNRELGTGKKGGEKLATTEATPGAGAGDPSANPPPGSLREGAGEAPPAPPPPRPAPRKPDRGGADVAPRRLEPPSAAQLRTLAEMAAERGTTLECVAQEAGIPISRRNVTRLRATLELLPKLSPAQRTGASPVSWADLESRLEDGDPQGAVALLQQVPAGDARAKLWQRVERYCRAALPAGADPEAVLASAGVESIRHDLVAVWGVIARLRAGDRTVLPRAEPDTPEARESRALMGAIGRGILERGNGNSAVLLERLRAATAANDLPALRALAGDLDIVGASS